MTSEDIKHQLNNNNNKERKKEKSALQTKREAFFRKMGFHKKILERGGRWRVAGRLWEESSRVWLLESGI